MKTTSILVVAILSIPSVLGGLGKRDTPLVRSNVPIMRTKDGRYAVTVNMSSSNPQTFVFALSTSTGLISVLGSACTNCTGSPTYNPSLSASAKTLDGTQGVSVLSQTTQGSLIKEDCTLQKADGTSWAYPNQTIVVANQSSSIFTSGISGLIGLGTNSFGGMFDETIFGGWLSRNPTRNNFSYGMQLNPPSKQGIETDGGMLHWVVPDSSAYQGTISVKDKLQVDSNTIKADWIVDMDAFSFASGNGPTLSANNQKAAIDPYFTGIFLPQSVARAIYAGIPGSSTQQSKTPSDTTAYSVPCDTKMTLNVRFGDVSVTLKEDALIFQNGTSCVSALEEWNDAGISEYLFGATFISAVYLIFTVSGPGNGSIGFGMLPSQSSKIHPAAIAGIVIGSVAIVVVAVFTAIIVLRTKKRHDEKKEGLTIQPFTATRMDEQQGLLVPNTPTTAGTQTGFNISSIPSPNLSTNTSPYSTANTRQSLMMIPEMVVTSPPIVVDHLAPPPPYSGASSEAPPQSQQLAQQPSGSASRPTSAGSSTGYGYPSEKRRRA